LAPKPHQILLEASKQTEIRLTIERSTSGTGFKFVNESGEWRHYVGPCHTMRHAGPHRAIQFLAVSFCQIVNNSHRSHPAYPASVAPRPTRWKLFR
jgi:hypothetical protein